MNTTTYRPENVRVVEVPEGERQYKDARYLLIDCDDTKLQFFANRSDADAAAKRRRGVIKAAITRRANKAR